MAEEIIKTEKTVKEKTNKVNTVDSDKEKEAKALALKTALSKIEKEFGKGAIMNLDDYAENVDTISSGSLSVDLALGVGGMPAGRIIEIYGPESSGKTTLALQTVAEAQKLGKTCAYIDVEHALDPKYMRNLGINLDNLLIAQPDAAEDALDIAEELIRSGAISLLVMDSVASLCPKKEIEGSMDDNTIGLLARLMSQALRKLTGIASKNNCTVIFINQLREKIGVMFGNPETTPGGRALKYFSSVRIDIRRVEAIKVNGEIIGNRTRVKVVKNKVASPFKECVFDIIYGKGVNKSGEIADLGVEYKIIEKGGAWFTCDGQRFQGRDNLVNFLTENPDVAQKIKDEIITKFNEPKKV